MRYRHIPVKTAKVKNLTIPGVDDIVRNCNSYPAGKSVKGYTALKSLTVSCGVVFNLLYDPDMPLLGISKQNENSELQVPAGQPDDAKQWLGMQNTGRTTQVGFTIHRNKPCSFILSVCPCCSLCMRHSSSPPHLSSLLCLKDQFKWNHKSGPRLPVGNINSLGPPSHLTVLSGGDWKGRTEKGLNSGVRVIWI